MLRLLHTADVHLGARHTDLGERATVLRERQFAAFHGSVEVAMAEGVDVFLVAGDLFDSNTQPRRSVERVAAELGRLTRAGIRTVIIPGTHDVYDGASIYRAYDLASMSRSASDWVVVLTPYVPEVVFAPLDLVVYGRVFDAKRSPRSPLAGVDARSDPRAAWKVGMVHGALRIPGKTESDNVVFSEDEIARSGFDYLALGHWHSAMEGKAGLTSYAYSGAPEPVALDQEGAGHVLVVTLDESEGSHTVEIEAKRVGQTTFDRFDVDIATVKSQPDLIDRIGQRADANLVLGVRLLGHYPDELDLDVDEVERALAASFLRLRVQDETIPAVPDASPPPPDTVVGAFCVEIDRQLAELAASNDPNRDAEAAELREIERLGRHLLEGRQVTL